MSNDVSTHTSTTTQRIHNALMDIVGSVPTSSCSTSTNPKQEANKLVFRAKAQASAIAGSLALPPGPFGMLTILPDLIMIWKTQAQLVADIAALYGKTAELKQEAMLYCLFRHGVASLTRDVLMRVGERLVIRRAGLRFMQKMLAQVGVRITQKVIGKTIARWIPLAGAIAVAGYAWHDTAKVGETAIDLFSQQLALDDKTTEDAPVPAA